MLLNARMSPRSYGRWRRAPALARHVLGSFARVQAQSETDAGRLRDLGAHAVTAPGNLKFAAPPLPFDAAELAGLRHALDGRPIWLAASTHPGEDALIVRAHRELAGRHRGLLTVIAPRHPDRGARIAAETGGIPAARRATGEPPPAEGVWIADTLGELGLFYRLAGIAFVGRSLIPSGGGQNPLEPARLGCAVAVGPHTGNFMRRCRRLRLAAPLPASTTRRRWRPGWMRCSAIRRGARRWAAPRAPHASGMPTCRTGRLRSARSPPPGPARTSPEDAAARPGLLVARRRPACPRAAGALRGADLRGDGPPRAAGRLASAGPGDLLRQCHGGRRGQDHGGAGHRPG